MAELEKARQENFTLKNDNKLTYLQIQKENGILKSELQNKYKEIVDLKRGINHYKAKEFVEKKLLAENEKLRNEIKSKIDEIENLREYILKMSEISGTYGNIDLS